jgi:opacity protein-like surface antigen
VTNSKLFFFQGKENITMKIIRFLLITLFSLPVFSATGHMYVGGSVAASFSKLSNGEPQITYISGGTITDTYPRNNRRESSSVVAVNGGYEFIGSHWKPAIALGMGLYTTPVGYTYNGQVIETPSGGANDTLFDYSYNISNTRVMAEAQFTWMLGMFAPFVDAGVGPSWNRVNGYTETLVSGQHFTNLPDFKTRTSTTIAYQAGLGVSALFNFGKVKSSFKHERVSIGYRYVDLGNTSLGSRGMSYPHKLSTGTLTANDIYIAYTHLF